MFRCFLLLIVALASSPLQADPQSISILYKRETGESAQRVDSAVQSALQTLEEKLIDGGYAVIQPDPRLYAELDRATGVVINFAADAGLSLTLDLIKSKRPENNSDLTWAEVRIKARVFNGRRVLASLSHYDQIAYRGSAEDKAFEATARRAVAALAEKLGERLASAPPPEAPPAASPQAPPVIGASPLEQPAKRWAILFGVSDFSLVRKLSPNYGVGDLPGVAGDLASMKKLAAAYGIAAENTFFLLNKDATTSALRQALATVAQKSAPGDQLLIYLSSHGMPKEEGISGMGYPVSYDTRINVRPTLIDFEEIQQRLRAMPARRVLWVADTCHAGGAAEGMKVVEFSSRNIGVKKADNALSADLAVAAVDKDIAVLTASRAEQTAIDDPKTGHGLFTYFFTEALQKDGKRTIYRLYKEDLEEAVAVAARSRYQHPQQPGFARSGQGDLITF